MTLKVQTLLEQSGCHVILTRSDEQAIYDLDKQTLRQKKVSDIKNRVKIGNNSSADIFVSIHLNKIPQSQYYGWQTFFKQGNEQSKKLATSIQNNLNQAIPKQNDRVPLKIDNVYIMKNIEIPTSIVECGFLSNPEEEKQLLQEEYQDKLAWGIYTGIMEYFF
ncbi:MAG: N-acetylmuramoyl-L-alanine amidase [Clostridia bacterium]|nr:N-acetylmuramoyl-L-alanine amidase [Clostridia bacterium]